MSNEIMYKELIAFHPGSYIEDIIEDLNITQKEFAERLGTSRKTISKIINGEERISNDTANKLAKLTGVSIETWLNLQKAYDIKVIEIENEKDEDDRNFCDLVDFSYFKRNHFVEDTRYTVKEKIEAMRKLLNVSSLSFLYDFNEAVSYRNTLDFTEKSIVNSNIMLEIASNIARNKTDTKYNKDKLEKSLPEIRKMTLEEPEVFYPRLEEILLDCGIVLVGLPKLKNANLQGATKKFKNGSVLLLITDRNKNADIFWFSLVHELAHIYNNDFYSNYKDKESYDKKEKEADKIAQEFFIPNDQYRKFTENGVFTKDTIKNFARELEIHPSIVVGRLQNEEYIKYYQFNDLKVQYSFSFEK